MSRTPSFASFLQFCLAVMLLGAVLGGAALPGVFWLFEGGPARMPIEMASFFIGLGLVFALLAAPVAAILLWPVWRWFVARAAMGGRRRSPERAAAVPMVLAGGALVTGGVSAAAAIHDPWAARASLVFLGAGAIAVLPVVPLLARAVFDEAPTEGGT